MQKLLVLSNLPQISILIPAKNAAATIHIAIEDAIKQTLVDWHIIIANDGSTDETQTVIESYQQYTDKITVLQIPQPGGIVAGRNALLKAVQTPYLAWLDADDGWPRADKLIKQIAFLEKHKDHALVGDGKVNGVFLENLKQKTFSFPLLNEDVQLRLLFKNAFIMSSLVARTAMVKDIGFDEKMEYLEDYVWVQTVASKYKVANMVLKGTLHFISTPKKQQEKDTHYQVYEKEALLLANALKTYGIDIKKEEAKLLSYFVRRNKKLNVQDYSLLKATLFSIKESLINKGFKKAVLEGFFFDIQWRAWRCRYLYF